MSRLLDWFYRLPGSVVWFLLCIVNMIVAWGMIALIVLNPPCAQPKWRVMPAVLISFAAVAANEHAAPAGSDVDITGNTN